MDIAKALVKCVARAFYDTRHILVLDALMIHNAVRDDELARLLGLVTKDVHKLCGKLKEDRMLSVHSRPEQKDGQQRPVNRTYYYIEFRSTIDGIKYRVYKLAELVRRSVNNGAETKGYVCPRCSKRFALLDALSLDVDEAGLFLCDRCSFALVDDEESTETKLGHEKIQRMNRQIEKIERFLREVDQVQIPFNDFDHAIANSVPVPKDKNQLQSAQFVPVNQSGQGGANRQNAQQALEISITSSSEKTTEELKAEQQRKQQQAEKNALPVWHTQSTVQPGAVTNAGLKEAAERAARERDGVGIARKEAEAEEEKTAVTADSGTGGDAIAQYYAALAAEKAREEAEDAEEDDSDDEEEEEEDEDEEVDFEDLDVSGNGGAVTVTSTGTGTGVVTPATGNGESEEDENTPPQKRARIDAPPAPAPQQQQQQEEDSEEEVDFEDV